MSYDFVDDIWLRSVIRILDVSQILRGAEKFKCKSV